MNTLAKKLNDQIKTDNPYVYALLSKTGKSLYSPKGILSQAAEANLKAFRFNATIGIATEDQTPMHFTHIQQTLDEYAPEDIYPYAPSGGKIELREEWRKKLYRDNPTLNSKVFGMPITTNALTHGLSIVADMFVDEGDSIILPDKYWENYQLIFNVLRGGNLKTFSLFNEKGKFDVLSFKNVLLEQKHSGKAIVMLNFPNNPTGYTPYPEEVEGIISALLDAANSGINLAVILDDAYYGLFYDSSVKESLFGRLANLHDRILPIKVDGATKENYVWGLRVGFLTFASKSMNILDALEQKTLGMIRGTISSSSHLSQTIILRSLQSNEFEVEKNQKYEMMKKRAEKVQRILENRDKKWWTYYPFNSGYFMCLKLLKIDAEQLRLHLLEQYGVGVVAINSTEIRIAFSCVEESDLEELFDLIDRGISDLTGNKLLGM